MEDVRNHNYTHTHTPNHNPVKHWDAHAVSLWLQQIGFGDHDHLFLDAAITGELLLNLDHSTLADIGVRSVGKRIGVLNAIYHLKKSKRIAVEEEDHVPALERLWSFEGGDARVGRVRDVDDDESVDEVMRDVLELNNDIVRFREELMSVWKLAKERQPLPTPTPTLKNESNMTTTTTTTAATTADPFAKSFDRVHGKNPPPRPDPPTAAAPAPITNSNTATNISTLSRGILPSTVPHETGVGGGGGGGVSEKSPLASNVNPILHPPSSSNTTSTTSTTPTSTSSSNFRISPSGSTHQILTAMLQKYKIEDDWRNYGLYVIYKIGDEKREQLFGHDESPQRTFKALKEAGGAPVLTIRMLPRHQQQKNLDRDHHGHGHGHGHQAQGQGQQSLDRNGRRRQGSAASDKDRSRV